MGLAPYGRPIYSEAILEHLIDLKPDGSFRLNMRYFNYCSGLTMTNRRFHQLFGGSPRLPDSRLEQRHMDLAASIQVVTETLILNIARHVQERTGLRNLVLAGGVALNCVANGRLLREGPFESIWVQPAAGDAGGALGAALFTWFQLLKNTRSPVQPDAQQGSLLGPAFTGSDIAELLASKGITAPRLTREVLVRQVAGLLAREAVVGWFQGRMEFGPRALGNRSILGDPRSARMQSIMNLKIKFRESFRPFAPSVLAEAAGEWFDLPRGHDSPYMLLVAPILSVHRFKLTPEQLEIFTSHPDLNVRLDIPHSVLPAITHIDSSARVQTVDRERNPLFHDLLAAFQAQTGCPVLVNTSFNIRGEPIVCRPEEALNGFLATDLDVLVLGDHVIQKADVAHLKPPDRVKYSSQFERD
jgi:carbamoyltransferase